MKTVKKCKDCETMVEDRYKRCIKCLVKYDLFDEKPREKFFKGYRPKFYFRTTDEEIKLPE